MMPAAESGVLPRRNPSQLPWINLSSSRNLILAYQSFGVVYGDLSTSPLYVFRSTFIGKLHKHQTEETVFGAFSLIFWTLTLIPLLKYLLLLLSADGNGEGGTFALYSLLCRNAKLSLLPNQQAADEELPAYKFGPSTGTGSSSRFTSFLEKHKSLRTALLVLVLFGAAIVIGDGVLTPAISGKVCLPPSLLGVAQYHLLLLVVEITHLLLMSSMSGLQATEKKLTDGELLVVACVVLVGLFALQHCGTHRVAFMFAPIVIIWLISILFIGLYNIIHWNPKIIHAISPHYIIKFFRVTGQDGWISLGGVLLSVTGTEAMFANLGHFTSLSIRLAFAVVVYPCLVVQYMGQAAFLSKNLGSIPNSFYDSIPDTVFWPVFVIATLAAIVGSQAVITATFSIIKQCHALGCFPRIKVVHTSKHIYGQIYIPEINWILMILTLAIAIGFRDTTLIGNAYGLACIIVMFVTTFFMALVIVVVWEKSIFLAALFLGTVWIIEGVYLSAALMKVPQGGWVPLVLAFILMIAMYVWHYGTRRKYSFDLHNKVSLKWLLGLGPSLGIVRVPGIGLVYSELATGVPAIFSHFVTNLPAFHKVVVFVCVKSVPVPHVSPEERYLIGRVCPKPYRMYRCVVRYGYKDIQREDGDFENQLVQSIAEFIQMEASDLQQSSSASSESQSYDGRMAVLSSQKSLSNSILTAVSEENDFGEPTILESSSKSMTLQSLRSVYEDEYPQGQVRRRRVRFRLTPSSGGAGMESSVREELMDLIRAKEAGVAYIMGHSYVKSRKSSSWLKKMTIDIGYSFLRKNCRGPAVALNVPHISLIEVGMIYYV
ncbi:PREDICTED: potassium transporter 4 isoform X2 [Camelina sativa]|uniref:Potassium transporter n=1 Tax=Camelina sativa TaxID=90675 RepID=A0ABM0Y6Q7_CAMSA|nr:PREDICTED: potassium transporter 4 isoform X2 [Camelina sativa]